MVSYVFFFDNAGDMAGDTHGKKLMHGAGHSYRPVMGSDTDGGRWV